MWYGLLLTTDIVYSSWAAGKKKTIACGIGLGRIRRYARSCLQPVENDSDMSGGLGHSHVCLAPDTGWLVGIDAAIGWLSGSRRMHSSLQPSQRLLASSSRPCRARSPAMRPSIQQPLQMLGIASQHDFLEPASPNLLPSASARDARSGENATSCFQNTTPGDSWPNGAVGTARQRLFSAAALRFQDCLAQTIQPPPASSGWQRRQLKGAL